MPDIVTFDGPNKVITVIDQIGVSTIELDVVEIYSEWKVWAKTSDNLKFLRAFSLVGGDPLTATQNLGVTYFLENGWRIRPSEKDHKLVLVGNIFTREEGQSVFLPTIGSFTVNTETRVSNLVDSSVARLDLNQLLEAVYIDVALGSPGTGTDVGTPTNPSNNLTDAKIIAANRTLTTFRLRGSLSLDQDLVGYNVVGDTSDVNHSLVINGYSVEGATFSDIRLTGVMTGRITNAFRCGIDVVSGLDGRFRECVLLTSFTAAMGAEVQFLSCDSDGVTELAVTLAGMGSRVAFHDFSGRARVFGMDDPADVVICNADGAFVAIDASNTAGTFIARGAVAFEVETSAVSVVDERAYRLRDGWLT